MRLRRIFIRHILGKRNYVIFITLFLFGVLTMTLALATKTIYENVMWNDKEFEHFRRNRNLKYYLDNIKLLEEPNSHLCRKDRYLPLIVAVSSAADRGEHRNAIRRSWGSNIPIVFVTGVGSSTVRDANRTLMREMIMESAKHQDLVIYNIKDSDQYLTIKTGLLMQWVATRCKRVGYMFKVMDDTMVNSWHLQDILTEKGPHTKFIGQVVQNEALSRNRLDKHYIPPWLCADEIISQYLSGAGYIIRGKLVSKLLLGAQLVPLHNREDIYFTYHVAVQTLGYELNHDDRLTDKRPVFFSSMLTWVPLPSCAYWPYLSLAGFSPKEMVYHHAEFQDIFDMEPEQACAFYERVFKPWTLMV